MKVFKNSTNGKNIHSTKKQSTRQEQSAALPYEKNQDADNTETAGQLSGLDL